MKRKSSHLNTPSPRGLGNDPAKRLTPASNSSTSTSPASDQATEIPPDPTVVDRKSSNSGSNSGRGSWRSMSLSLLMHTLLVTFLLLFVSIPGRGSGEEGPRNASIVLAVDSLDNKTEYLTEETAQPETESAVDPSSTPASAAAAAAPAVDLQSLELPGMRPLVNDTTIDATNMTELQGNSNSKVEIQLSDEDLKTIAKDQQIIRSRKPKGDPASMNVFGIRGLEGRRFVFVIDRSNSMGAGGLGVIEMAQKELTNAVADLKPHHSFQVVAYHDGITTISGKQMLDATEANKAELPKFLASLAAFGGTSHEHGLFAGLSFRPDVLVLMTDGGDPVLGGAELKYFRNFAKNQTEIHCLQFGAGPNQETKNFMMQLARENKGNYRYIDIDQWDRK